MSIRFTLFIHPYADLLVSLPSLATKQPQAEFILLATTAAKKRVRPEGFSPKANKPKDGKNSELVV